MSVKAAFAEYTGPVRDAIENFHGNQLVYVAWDEHLMFPCAAAFPFPPTMPFDALVKDVLPSVYGIHPDFAKIEWSDVKWTLDDEAFDPELTASLAGNGVKHKSLIRLATPGLHGIGGIGY
ncbi:phenol hydroxylase subunit P4 [Paraburkholderia fungorum]|uniref:phenol hydroxylase subunit P4 n=1 Tax=Paraburkholderia fungorum TaxID=134537 RepID=UPI00160EA1D5|nr:phenol hydroxylase subunit P4 [Paraburkholderia fungorum]MBB5547664.1 phenol hydroxylase P4 protein [Paraburkholderia fungorum]